MKLAVLFSGQGSQFVNMGLDLINSNPQIYERIKLFEKELDLPLLKILSNEELLNDTRYTQPAMVLYQILLYDRLKEKYNLKIDGFTGFSLGEFSSFYATNIFNDLDTLKIVNKRALLMQEASKKINGKMAAIIGLDDKTVEEVCKEISTPDDFVSPVNYNSPGQLVISGSFIKVSEAINLLKEKGAKRALMLNVSGPFHSKYMENASELLFDYVKNFKSNKPNNLVYINTNAKILKDDEIYQEIRKQIMMPVYFKQSIENMAKDGYTHFLEIGPGKVLYNLIKRINPSLEVFHYDNNSDLEKLKEIF